MDKIGLTDWSSFLWGAGAMFVFFCLAAAMFVPWMCNAPSAEEYEERELGI